MYAVARELLRLS